MLVRQLDMRVCAVVEGLVGGVGHCGFLGERMRRPLEHILRLESRRLPAEAP